jgi:large subunit ribosomal protein L6
MARIGKRVLEIPKGVEVKVGDGRITVKGPKATLLQDFRPEIQVIVDQDKITTLCESQDSRTLSLQGLYNSLIKNMIDGVTKGFQKELDLVGVGYRAQLQGKKLQVSIGYSHPVEVDPPEGIVFEMEGQTRIRVKGSDRQVVGEIAAQIRDIREVEPYKGKGIRYVGEVVRKKAGKAAKTAGGAA